MTDAELKRLAGVLMPLQVKAMPLDQAPPRESRFGSSLELSRVHWLRPEVVVEVAFSTWTPTASFASHPIRPSDTISRRWMFVAKLQEEVQVTGLTSEPDQVNRPATSL